MNWPQPLFPDCLQHSQGGGREDTSEVEHALHYVTHSVDPFSLVLYCINLAFVGGYFVLHGVKRVCGYNVSRDIYFHIIGRERAPFISDPCDGETSSIQSTA